MIHHSSPTVTLSLSLVVMSMDCIATIVGNSMDCITTKESHMIGGNAMALRAIMPALCAALASTSPEKLKMMLAGDL